MQNISRQFIFAATTVISVIFGILLESLSGDLLETWDDETKIALLITLGLLLSVFAWLQSRLPSTQATLGQSIILNEERNDASQKHIKRGLVMMVSPYSPQTSVIGAELRKAADAEKVKVLEKIEAAKQTLDFETLDLPNSNLAIGIKAVKAHASKLEVCWLLSTEDLHNKNGELIKHGSFDSARLLASYLSQLPELANVEFLYEDYTIPQGVSSSIVKSIRDAMDRVFKDANALKIDTQSMAADMTSGTGAMKLGMVLASLDGNRDIQFVGTTYAEDNNPIKGELNPILYPFTVTKT